MGKKTKRYNIAIVPSSEDEHHFDGCYNYHSAAAKHSALEKRRDTNIPSFKKFVFATEDERNAFIQGYQAALGYNGNGLYFVNQPMIL